MVNNFNEIAELLTFNNNDEFYFLQILQRKKDNPNIKGTNNNSRVVKTYYIRSVEHLLSKEDEIINICCLFNARAGINLNRRSFKKCALQTARLILDQIANNDYNHAKNAFNSICGRYSSETDKKWMLDYDEELLKFDEITDIENNLYKCRPIGEKIIQIIKTKNGQHIITKPFKIKEADHILKKYQLDIHKNNPTILFIP